MVWSFSYLALNPLYYKKDLWSWIWKFRVDPISGTTYSYHFVQVCLYFKIETSCPRKSITLQKIGIFHQPTYEKTFFLYKIQLAPKWNDFLKSNLYTCSENNGNHISSPLSVVISLLFPDSRAHLGTLWCWSLLYKNSQNEVKMLPRGPQDDRSPWDPNPKKGLWGASHFKNVSSEDLLTTNPAKWQSHSLELHPLFLLPKTKRRKYKSCFQPILKIFAFQKLRDTFSYPNINEQSKKKENAFKLLH